MTPDNSARPACPRASAGVRTSPKRSFRMTFFDVVKTRLCYVITTPEKVAIRARAVCQVAGRARVRGSRSAEPVGFSHGDFGFVVQTFDDAARELLLSASPDGAIRRGTSQPRWRSCNPGVAQMLP